ncbi:MAG: ATP-binding protein [Bacillota bacterium]|jgi:MinD superfamily P-loop ATPase|nr:ATP-binding protein [Bacillota bacterium]NLL27096.1 4Fe-4S binding protein [Erysipelotrichia bacterium]
MKIAILSGKGGTGKTLVSVNLAAVSEKATYIDCDVEEANGHLFFKPQWVQEESIAVKIPEVDEGLCDGCRKCVDFCKFNALAYILNKLKIFEEICHSCGGCLLVCPQKALTEKDKVIGIIKKGISNNVTIYSGLLNTGEPSGVPIINRLLSKNHLLENKLTIIDCPPGSACVVMESIKDADYCILVAEPTLFGVHNLNMVYQLVKLFEKPFGVVLNKCTEDDNPAEKFCYENNIKILGKIPFDSKLGTLNSNGEIIVNIDEKYKEIFSSLLDTVIKEVRYETVANP